MLRPSPSLVIAIIALVVALGGTSYAVTRIPAHSVGSLQIRNGAVTRAKIARSAIDSSKVAFNALTGLDINERKLKKVGSAINADHATAAAGLDKIVYKSASGTAGANGGVGTATATCDAGQHAISGGVRVDDANNEGIADSMPVSGGGGWTAHVFNIDSARGHGFSVIAVCVPATAVG
jgi:hypothetical protein